MLLRADSAEPVLLFMRSGRVLLGYVLYNSQMETVRHVLERREWFELQWPHILNADWMAIPLMKEAISVQRSSVEFYTLEVEENLLKQLPPKQLLFGPPKTSRSKGSQTNSPSNVIPLRRRNHASSRSEDSEGSH